MALVVLVPVPVGKLGSSQVLGPTSCSLVFWLLDQKRPDVLFYWRKDYTVQRAFHNPQNNTTRCNGFLFSSRHRSNIKSTSSANNRWHSNMSKQVIIRNSMQLAQQTKSLWERNCSCETQYSSHLITQV